MSSSLILLITHTHTNPFSNPKMVQCVLLHNLQQPSTLLSTSWWFLRWNLDWVPPMLPECVPSAGPQKRFGDDGRRFLHVVLELCINHSDLSPCWWTFNQKSFKEQFEGVKIHSQKSSEVRRKKWHEICNINAIQLIQDLWINWTPTAKDFMVWLASWSHNLSSTNQHHSGMRGRWGCARGTGDRRSATLERTEESWFQKNFSPLF